MKYNIMSEQQGNKIQIPTDFKKIIVDMTKDVLVSFPEIKYKMNEHLYNLVFENNVEQLEHSLKYVFIFCKTIFPQRFFDILYQNTSIFENDIEFLPGINFKILWNENITDKTRETIWKYLQLVLFNIVSSISDGKSFGDTAKLFEAINQDEFKSKLEETITQMQSLFGDDDDDDDNNNDDDNEQDKNNNEEKSNDTDASGNKKTKGINLDDLPNPADIHEHVSNMMNGKLGKLAREIAEETASDLNIDMENAGSINDVFKRLISNPTKLMGLVKNVGSKLDEKMKSGEVKESELLEEASEMMKKMKDMPGMGDIQSMLSKMGLNTKSKGNGKVNVSAMQNNLEKKLKETKMREQMLERLNKKKAAKEEASSMSLLEQTEMLENLVNSMSSTNKPNTPTTSEHAKKPKKKKNKKN